MIIENQKYLGYFCQKCKSIPLIQILVKETPTKIFNACKYIKIRLGIFYFLQLTSLLVMTYYLFVFCAVYDHSQGSIFINYLIGSLISLATSTGLTIIITFLRAISIKYRSVVLFNVSKYLYEHF